MQLLNEKNLEQYYFGEEVGSRIMFGDKVVWEGIKMIDMGVGQTFDVKNYTDKWQNLTVDNFFMIGASGSASISGSDSDTSYINYIYDGFNKSYNASTGILTFRLFVVNGHWDRWGYGNVHAVLVENKNKLIYLGAGTSFNVKPYKNYADFTYKNFLMSRPNLSSGAWNQIAGVRGPVNWSAYSQVRASYSNGVFGCDYFGQYNHQNYDSVTPRQRSDGMVVYLFPRKIRT